MVMITIRLVGEEKDKLFKRIELDPQIHIDDLVKEIETVTAIPPIFLQVEFRGDELPHSLHPLESIKDFEELVVKHSELDRWELYQECVTSELDSDDARVANAKEAVILHEELLQSGFFDAYISFNRFRMKNHPNVAFWADEIVELMLKATRKYFWAQHILKRGDDDDSDFYCRFESPPRDVKGTHHNIHAYVRIYGEGKETKYNVKCHYLGPSSSTQTGDFPDIKELFCYKLLELINVGPHVQFIHPCRYVGTRTCMYIASKWNDDFVRISNTEEKDLSVEVLVQLVLLRVVLFLSDLIDTNCGHWKGTMDAAIVDFIPYPSRVQRLKNQLFDTVPHHDWADKYTAAMKECDQEKQLHIAKEYLKKWNLPSNIDLANERIKPDMDRLKSEGVGLKGCDADLAEFINDVKQNLKELIEALNFGE